MGALLHPATLDEPGAGDAARPTKPPSVPPSQRGALMEAMHAQSTRPPAPTCPMLRDSCSSIHVAAVSLDDDDDATVGDGAAGASALALVDDDAMVLALCIGLEDAEWFATNPDMLRLMLALDGQRSLGQVAYACGLSRGTAIAMAQSLVSAQLARPVP